MDTTLRQQELREQFETNKAQFLMTEVNTATTFCEVAKASDNPEKTRRNVEHASEGYNTLLRFQDRTHFDAAAQSEFDSKLEHLKELLRELGQNV
jgi:hypothetical protein